MTAAWDVASVGNQSNLIISSLWNSTVEPKKFYIRPTLLSPVPPPHHLLLVMTNYASLAEVLVSVGELVTVGQN